jgi:hypothetical protein
LQKEHPNPHLHDAGTATRHGVPKGVVQEESLGVPDSGRHASESGPLHAENPDRSDKA